MQFPDDSVVGEKLIVLSLDSENNLFVADGGNNRIRKITSSGEVSTIAGAGTGVSVSADGPGNTAYFAWPWGIELDSKGSLIVSEFASGRVRKITME